jgi:hypothetical protein
MQSWRELRPALTVCGLRGTATVLRAHFSRDVPVFRESLRTAIDQRRVLEIGGPSDVFRPTGTVPVYDRAARVDNVNYAGATLWEVDLREGGPFSPEDRVIGSQHLREATDLGALAPVDTVVSSHTIEHTANPLKALRDWRRVTIEGGMLVLVVPHADGTFDHRRPITTLAHMHDDEKADVDESDVTHAEEILRLHDVSRDPGLASREVLEERVVDNLSLRSMHHHVFDTRTAWDLVAASGWSPLAVEAVWPHNIVLLARNGGPAAQLGRFRSPFPRDRTSRV